MTLDVRLQKLAVATGRSVFIFEVERGTLLSRHINIHTSRIRDVMFIADDYLIKDRDDDDDVGNGSKSGISTSNRRVLISCCGDGLVKLWRTRQAGALQLFHVISAFTSPVVSFCTLKGEKALLLGTDDGFIHLIDLETLEHLHRSAHLIFD